MMGYLNISSIMYKYGIESTSLVGLSTLTSCFSIIPSIYNYALIVITLNSTQRHRQWHDFFFDFMAFPFPLSEKERENERETST